MKIKYCVINVLALLAVLISPTSAGLFDDGNYHIVDDGSYIDLPIWIDSRVANDPGTHISITKNGKVKSVGVFNYGQLTLSGGNISDKIWATDYSKVLMTDGVVYDLQAHKNAIIDVKGGEVTFLAALENATINILGGTISDKIIVGNNSKISLEGSNFSVTNLDGKETFLSYGDKLSDFGSYVINPINNASNQDYYTGTINGVLANGDILNSEFRVYNTGLFTGTADIVIVPEPVTLYLLVVGGGLVLTRAKSKNETIA